jgi:hypothetical protein
MKSFKNNKSLLNRKISRKFESFYQDVISDSENESSVESSSTSHHSSIELNLRSKLSNLPVETLLNFLNEKFSSFETKETRQEFEQLTMNVLVKHQDNELNRVLNDHGWVGSRFSMSDDKLMEPKTFLQALSNLYLKQKSARSAIEKYFDKDVDFVKLQQISSFCPDILLEYLQNEMFGNHNNSSSTKSVRSFEFVGACMLADISGFSNFAAAMCLDGISGLDELREVTNGFLGKIQR